jgi:hypothetical protein
MAAKTWIESLMRRIVSRWFQNQTKFEHQLESYTVLIQIADMPIDASVLQHAKISGVYAGEIRSRAQA